MNTIFYAYPLDLFDETPTDEQIISAYENNKVSEEYNLPVLKLTPEELAEKINDDMFDGQDYYLRVIREDKAFYEQEKDLRKNILNQIISILKKEKIKSLTFSRFSQDYHEVYIDWHDRHDYINTSRLDKIEITNKDKELKLILEDGVEVYTDTEPGAWNIETLNNILDSVIALIEELPTLTKLKEAARLMQKKGTVHFDHKSYDNPKNIPSILIGREWKKIDSISIDPECQTIEIVSGTDRYSLDVYANTPKTSLSKMENNLREAGIEEVLEAIYDELGYDIDLIS